MDIYQLGESFNPSLPTMNSDSTPPSISLNLRKIRRGKNLSLADVERLSEGRIKAMVLGSYERGSRALSVRKAVLIANIYQVPLADLIDPLHRENASPTVQSSQSRMIVDMKKLVLLTTKDENTDAKTERELDPIYRFMKRIVESRQDWNGEIISLRSSDITILSILVTMNESQCLEMLYERGLILTARSLHP